MAIRRQFSLGVATMSEAQVKAGFWPRLTEQQQALMRARADAWAALSDEERAYAAARGARMFLHWLEARNRRLDAAVAAGALDPYDPSEVQDEDEEVPFPEGTVRPWAAVRGGQCKSATAGAVYGWLAEQATWVTAAEIAQGCGIGLEQAQLAVTALARRELLVRRFAYVGPGRPGQYAVVRVEKGVRACA